MLTIDHYLRLLEEAYGKTAWHGPNLKGAIRGIDFAEAALRHAPDRHNIWEIVVHTAYWKYAVRRRLTGAKRGSFALKGSDWFERPEQKTKAAWRQDLALLEEEHRLLCEAVGNLSPSKFHKPALSQKKSAADLIIGAAYHDVYHAGQIRLLRRMECGA